MFKLGVQEGATQPALTKACPWSVAEPFLDVGDKIVRRQNTSRGCVQVVEPLVGDVRVAQVLYSRHLLPGTLEKSVFFKRVSRVPSDNRESCAWRCPCLSAISD